MKIATLIARILAGFAVLFATTLTAQPTPFNISIERGLSTNGLVTGTISVNGQEIGKTYENASLKIPAGAYTGLLRYVSGHNFVGGPFGTISKRGDFLVEISGVTGGRTDILFHGGNRPYQSRGCILLGPVARDPGSSIPSLDNEHPLRKLRLLFYGTDVPNSTPDKAIRIQISDRVGPEHYDLTGRWLRDDGELVSITQNGSSVVATKVVPGKSSFLKATDVSWQGEYTSNSFRGKGQKGDKNGRRMWVPVSISVQDKNTLRVTGFSPDRTYKRSDFGVH